jgi:ribosomal-protein-alanine N-acetyltransferase
MGTIGYWNPFSSKHAALFKGLEIWYQLHPSFRTHGFATQAACLLVNHLFDSTPIERIQATVVVGNDASCHVAEGAGMQRDGIYRKVFFLHGRYVDMHLFAIVRDDWEDELAYRQGRRPF